MLLDVFKEPQNCALKLREFLVVLIMECDFFSKIIRAGFIMVEPLAA